jgi:hypothetical protein
MAFKIVVQEVTLEDVVKGRSKYSIANVVYSFNGQNKTQKLMSFANPQVFKDIQGLVGKTVLVETSKNAAGYDQWAKVVDVDNPEAGGSTGPSKASTTPVKSTYETPEERARRQVLIVRQSSISSAIQTLSVGAKVAPQGKDVLELAQVYVDWVFENSFGSETNAPAEA